MKKQLRRWVRPVAILSALTLFAAACGDDDSSSGGQSSDAPATEDTASSPDASDGGGAAVNSLEGDKVGFVLSGAANDGGYYQEQATAMENLSGEYGFEPVIVENALDPGDQIDGMRNLANEGATIIFVDGAMGASSAEVAPEFPDVQFIVMTAPTEIDLPNMHAYVVQQGVPSYILGQLAANISTSGQIGYIGGIELPPTAETRSGFFEGATATNADIQTAEAIVGDFSDVVGAKEAAAAQIANGVDAIYGYVDAGLLGVDQAAEESGKDVVIFAATVDRCDLSDRVVASAMANSEATINAALSDYVGGTLEPGTTYFGLEDPDIQWVLLCPKYDTPENQQLVKESTDAINSGEITLSSTTTGVS